MKIKNVSDVFKVRTISFEADIRYDIDILNALECLEKAKVFNISNIKICNKDGTREIIKTYKEKKIRHLNCDDIQSLSIQADEVVLNLSKGRNNIYLAYALNQADKFKPIIEGLKQVNLPKPFEFRII